MKIRRKESCRKGSVVVLTAIVTAVMCAVMAFALDLGYLLVIRAKLQSAADAAALAGALEILQARRSSSNLSLNDIQSLAKSSARDCATKNSGLGGKALNLSESDIVFGRVDLTAGPDGAMTFADPTRFNAVRILTRRTTEQNGQVTLFFAKMLGVDASSVQATATAAFSDNIIGFAKPGDSKTKIPLFPFAMDKPTWDAMMAGHAADDWSWNEDTQHVTHSPDGIKEVNLYPLGTGSPGNRGTVDIGNPNNSTSDISRQIREGISAADMAWMPSQKVDLSANGTLLLQGDTGMSNGIKDDLESIVGQTRVIPLFVSVAGNGNNAEYTIVQFVGIRVLAVNLTGNPTSRYVMIQPANVAVDGIPGGDGAKYSEFVFSKRVCLTR